MLDLPSPKFERLVCCHGSNHQPISRRSKSTTGGAWAGSTDGTDIRRTASSESKAWLGAVLQTVREGSAVAVQSLLADLRADGHIVPAAEADMVDDVERSTEPELDAEVDLGDKDDPTLEAWDDMSANQEGPMFALGADSTGYDGLVLIESGLEIIVEGEACRLHLAPWAGFESRTELGQRILDELANRFIVLGRVAGWLSESRKHFQVFTESSG